MKKIIIGGTHSGCGKTTVTCAVLQALCNRKLKVSSFKCGPDYIDTMFHEKIIGTSAHNLDSFFSPGEKVTFRVHLDTKDMKAGEALSIITLTTNSPLRPIVNLFMAGWIEE